MFSKYVLFKKGHLNKRAGVWTPWTPPGSATGQLLLIWVKWFQSSRMSNVIHYHYLGYTKPWLTCNASTVHVGLHVTCAQLLHVSSRRSQRAVSTYSVWRQSMTSCSCCWTETLTKSPSTPSTTTDYCVISVCLDSSEIATTIWRRAYDTDVFMRLTMITNVYIDMTWLVVLWVSGQYPAYLTVCQ